MLCFAIVNKSALDKIMEMTHYKRALYLQMIKLDAPLFLFFLVGFGLTKTSFSEKVQLVTHLNLVKRNTNIDCRFGR